LAVATAQFAEQADQLEEGMRQLTEVQVRIAQGDYTARAPLPEGRLLFPVAAMLNRLLDRFESLARGQEQYAQHEQVAAQAVRVARACQSLEAGDTSALRTLAHPSGTALDSIARLVIRLYQQMGELGGSLRSPSQPSQPPRPTDA